MAAVSTSSLITKVFSPQSEWNDKEEFLDVIYWGRQVPLPPLPPPFSQPSCFLQFFNPSLLICFSVWFSHFLTFQRILFLYSIVTFLSQRSLAFCWVLCGVFCRSRDSLALSSLQASPPALSMFGSQQFRFSFIYTVIWLSVSFGPNFTIPFVAYSIWTEGPSILLESTYKWKNYLQNKGVKTWKTDFNS